MVVKFLIVDDSFTMRRIVINSLKTLGYSDFIEANDGKEAFEKLTGDETINFVITDWNMPTMSGLEFIKLVRSKEKYTELPILMVTTRGVKDDILLALQAKVSNYIVKPFTPSVLKEKIEQILTAV